MYTDQQLHALRDALANGVRRVRFEGREVEYRTIDELKQAIAAAEVVSDVHWVSQAPGGRGAVRELVELLLDARGRWQDAANSVGTS